MAWFLKDKNEILFKMYAYGYINYIRNIFKVVFGIKIRKNVATNISMCTKRHLLVLHIIKLVASALLLKSQLEASPCWDVFSTLKGRILANSEQPSQKVWPDKVFLRSQKCWNLLSQMCKKKRTKLMCLNLIMILMLLLLK